MTQTLRLYSDFVCPYCFIAEESSLARLVREFDVAVDWRGFQLHPQTPVGGLELAQMFGPRAVSMGAQIQQFARSFGIDDMRLSSRMPNTRAALAVAELARDRGVLDAFRKSAMNAHWREGLDLEHADDMRTIASRAGLDPREAVDAMHDPALLARVDAMRIEANGRGVSGIPTVFLGEEKIVGCQPYETFMRAAERLGIQRRN